MKYSPEFLAVLPGIYPYGAKGADGIGICSRLGHSPGLRTVFCRAVAALLCLLTAFTAYAGTNPDWTTPLAPFRIADNLYYVGSRDLAAYLVVTPAGDILINSNIPSSPPLLRRSVEQLGFRWSDIRILLISHAHVDHAGGSAAILRQTGARYEVMEGDAGVVESGGRTDFAFGSRMQFPAAHADRVLQDGDTVSLGGVTLTAHLTAGHTRGCTTWTMPVHLPGEPAGMRRHAVIVGSWNVLSEYRLTTVGGRPPSYPGIAEDFRRQFAVLAALPCDVFLGAHGSYFGMLAKLQRMPAEGDRVWVDPEGYQRELAAHRQAFEADLARQIASNEGAKRH